MISVPGWLGDVVAEFGRSIGLERFALNEFGAAALAFETGTTLRFEYALESLVVVVTVPCANGPEAARRLLEAAYPAPRAAFTVRTAYQAKTGSAAFMVRLPEREAGLPTLNAVFAELWRRAEEFGRDVA